MLSFWVSECVSVMTECEPSTNSANLIRCCLIFETFLEMEFSSEYVSEMLLSFIFRPSVVKYDILRNKRCNELHAVRDCLFFFFYIILAWPGKDPLVGVEVELQIMKSLLLCYLALNLHQFYLFKQLKVERKKQRKKREKKDKHNLMWSSQLWAMSKHLLK